nr:CPBP family intramembrane glutamic endopeptidase [uncultured Holophaga sp.]
MPLPWRAGLFLLAGLLPFLTGFRLDPWTSALYVLALSWFALRKEDRGLTSLGFDLGRTWLRQGGLGLLLGLALMGLTSLLLFLAGAFRWAPGMTPVGREALWAPWIFLGVAIHEECLFRGYPFQRLVEAWGPGTAQVTLGAAFVLVHWQNPGLVPGSRLLPMLNIFLAGCLLGQCWLLTRSLALPMGLHLGWNWAQGSLLGFPVSGTTFARSPLHPILRPDLPAWLTGGAFGLEGSLACTLVCSATWLLLAHRTRSRPLS